jgi:hypothetical protein
MAAKQVTTTKPRKDHELS